MSTTTNLAPTSHAVTSGECDLAVLEEIQQKVLWLAVRMIDHANRERPDPGGIKVGGHQASSASLVSAMTALWFHHLNAHDQVSVKPHASPALHAINYLLGNLDGKYLTTLRTFGGLQAYPSQTKDPDRVDFSTGSVGLGAVAPLFAAVTRRYVDARFGPRSPSRFVSLIGDAELDEGNVWEAVNDPVTAGLGNVMWVVDFNRQSLDRVVPGVRIDQWRSHFEAAGWHSVEVKYGRRLLGAFDQPGGDALRHWIDSMPNEQYQSLFTCTPDELRPRLLEGAPAGVGQFLNNVADADLHALVTDLGGHDLDQLLAAYEACDAVTDRPSVVFAYTVKGWGLPFAGDPRNHGALLSGEQIAALRTELGLSSSNEWDRLSDETPAGQLARQRGQRLHRTPHEPRLPIGAPPRQSGNVSTKRPVATQTAFGRVLTALLRDPAVATHLVTTAPDVATTTNLAGFINRTGVFAPVERPAWASTQQLIEWHEGPAGQHLELGIGEMNFFLLLGQLGISHLTSDQPLVPIGTVYDPFVLRGLDAYVYANYIRSRFLLAGTPSGITLAPEGGAHQSTITPSIGIEIPHVTFLEPAYAQAVDWLMCDAIHRLALAADESGDLADPGGPDDGDGSYYLRLSTRPIDQEPFDKARARIGDEVLRRQVIAGAYRLVGPDATAPGTPTVNLAASGAVMPEVLQAADQLKTEGVAACVVDITSSGRLYRAWRNSIDVSIRHATIRALPGALHTPFFPGAPVVSVHDASAHALAWLGSALNVPGFALGVDSFGQSGTIDELYRHHRIDADMITNAALSVLTGSAGPREADREHP